VKFEDPEEPPSARLHLRLGTLNLKLLRQLALFDARDKSRGAIEFAINRYFLYIYALFWLDKPRAGIIL
jgi:hypothetical protein